MLFLPSTVAPALSPAHCPLWRSYPSHLHRVPGKSKGLTLRNHSCLFPSFMWLFAPCLSSDQSYHLPPLVSPARPRVLGGRGPGTHSLRGWVKEGAKANAWQPEEEGEVLSAGLGVTTVFRVWAPKIPSGFVNPDSHLTAFGEQQLR